ncbi:MAG: aminoacyl-tRNA hydrolase [Clostridia bacterium]|nr:aminoacyl-tRNA hydrolase [Clostridia bacterium]
MFVIVGLGNPGRDYANTRHNAGYMALDILADRFNIDIARHNFRSVYGEGRIGTEKVVLAKPETFMNNSGFAVRDLVNWYKVPNDHLIVVYDDADIPVGTLRMRAAGSAGTHNGMKSIVYQLGFDDFPRVRVGIGGAAHGMIGHVLGPFTEEEKPLVKQSLADAASALELIVKGEMKEAQARFNHKGKNNPKPEKPSEAAPAKEDGSQKG